MSSAASEHAVEPSPTKNKRGMSNNEFVFTELVQEPVHFVNTPVCGHDCDHACARCARACAGG